MFLKNQNITLIPNYLLNLSPNALYDLQTVYAYCHNISSSYCNKMRNKFYNQFSFISYNPFAFQRFQSKSKTFENCRRCICSKFIIIYRIYNKYVEVLNIFHSRSNYHI